MSDHPTAEVLYVPLSKFVSAKVTIEIHEAPLPTPHEQPHKRKPCPRELHDTAEGLVRRNYQFHPID
jgi:hypothetical protein